MTETVEQAARRLLAGKIARGYVPRALHAYVNPDGRPIYYRARLEHPDGDKAPEGRKIIRPLYPNGAGYKIGEPAFPGDRKPLYNLDRIAADPSAPVFVVEGEKAADALAKIGAIATTSGSADSAQRADWSPLAGRTCILWADNDDAGRAYMGDVAEILGPLGCQLSAINIELLALPPKADAFDWLADRAEASLGDLLALPRLEARPPGDRVSMADSGLPAVRLIRGDEIQPECIRWVWPGWFALGKLHILAGRPGCGKTTLALAIAATITTGGRWPDGTRTEVGNVLIWSGEDDPADTLVPRLIANGADMTRVYFVGTVTSSADQVNSFDPAIHMDALALEAARIGEVRMLVIDPVVSAVRGDGNSNTEVRRSLQPIVDLAARVDAIALGISHFTKGSEVREVVERVCGSLAFGAAARVVLGAAKIKPKDGDPGGRILVRAKCNIAPDSGGYRYDIDQVALDAVAGLSASRVLWGDLIEGDAKDILRDAEAPDDDSKESPRKFLADLLAHGRELSSGEVFSAAGAHGFSKEQMRRARETLRVKTRKAGMNGGWMWRLPDASASEDAEDAEDGTPSDSATFGATFDNRAVSEDGSPAGTWREDAGRGKPTPSAPSVACARRWRITRADGTSFGTTTVQAITAAAMADQYPECEIQQLDMA